MQVLQDRDTEYSILAERFAQLQENVMKAPSSSELVSGDSQIMKGDEHNNIICIIISCH